MKVLFRAAAAADVEDAYRSYEEQRSGLGKDFNDSISRAVSHIQRFPNVAPVLFRNTRQLPLDRFPYSLYYRVYEDLLVVVACLHSKRDPRMEVSLEAKKSKAPDRSGALVYTASAAVSLPSASARRSE